MAVPRLLADCMLGRLAKWLRILGYDTRYFKVCPDHYLARVARAEDRILLTRDHELSHRRGLRTILIQSEELEEQIHQVILEVGLPPGDTFGRCPVCNEPLRQIDRQAAKSLVPPYVWRTQRTFRQCPACKRVFWPGTHWQRMCERLRAWGLEAVVRRSDENG